ncbi:MULTISPECIES: MFS transporter [unclassified Spirosoma]|uniref:MFS transporter n=1 Tax=unclassified Spirosoma TaxID=2621999 RepID=UPI00095913CD|nr:MULTISPECIES: MFS transporter [unclassified Spirosoma]MBN8825429.1 MFS transporter [Spirosoma sp.]OJW74941.1 MAG: MFS transporter [Spirosoma sp. 48-14]
MVKLSPKLTTRQPGLASLRALDAANFFLADVRDGLGPYLAIYLLTTLHWDAQNIGIAMSVMGIATVIAQTPAGALVDRTHRKRAFSIVASLLIALAAIVTITVPTYSVILGGQAIMGVAAAWFTPAIAAITLGLVGPKGLDKRVGRNETFNHAGNVFAALLAGLLGYYVSTKGIFLLLAAMSILSSLSIWRIREEDIDHQLARGCSEEEEQANKDRSGWQALLGNRPILFFALACVLFHFANAAMLPLLGQRLAQGINAGASSAYMSACIIVAQLVMIPVSYLTGKLAPNGRKRLLLIGFAVLPIRGLLYTLTGDPILLVAIQILDGVGAGIFGVLSILIVSDLTRGSGLFNTTQGAIATAVGLGASLSNAFAGMLLQQTSYNVAFLTLAALALVALGVLWFLVPETGPKVS